MGAAASSSPPPASPAPAITTIASGADSGIDRPRQAVIRTTDEWQALWRDHAATNPVPPIDFDRRMVAGVFLGSRPSAGYGVTITNTASEGDTLVVLYREARPGPGMMTAAVMTTPFHLVALPRHAGPITFRAVDSSQP